MLNKEGLLINYFAQEKINLEQILKWFDSLCFEKQHEVILLSQLYLKQAQPNKEIVEKFIELIPLKPTVTPIVLLKTKEFNLSLQKIVSLPKNEYKKAFITLISLFKSFDEIRRNKWCKNGCTHEWHNLDKLIN